MHLIRLTFKSRNIVFFKRGLSSDVALFSKHKNVIVVQTTNVDELSKIYSDNTSVKIKEIFLIEEITLHFLSFISLSISKIRVS